MYQDEFPGVEDMSNESIKEWNYENLKDIPSEESNAFEYKSSRIPLDHLKNEISVAASSFWNSGDGIFAAGVNDNGIIDGGIPRTKGRQSIRDWADNAIRQTEPLGPYEIVAIEHDDSTTDIDEDRVVLVIRFFESNIVPHMAYDKKYYIRAGAHSDGATHFQVEALRSLRQFTKPDIRGVMRYHPSKPNVEELVIVSLNDAVALDTKLTFDPFPLLLKRSFGDCFPLKIPVIDRHNPFRLEISRFGHRAETFGEEPVKLILQFNDVIGNEYAVEQMISPQENLQPMAIARDVNEQLVRAIERLTKKFG